jgi:type I restriction enzyme, S subunit
MKNGWKREPLGDACQFINGLWKGEKPPFVKVGVFRNTNFTKEGTLDDTDIAYLDVEARKFEKRRLVFGDLILEKSGGGPKQAVGRVALFDKKDGEFSFSNFTAAMRVIDPDELDYRYLHKFLFWTHLSGVTESMQSHSTGIRNLDGDAYKRMEISYPPLPEQQWIVGILDEAFDGIATAKSNAEKNLQNARALFESHLNAVFTQRGEGWVERKLGDVAEFKNGLNFNQSSRGQSVRVVGVGDFQCNYDLPTTELKSVTIDGELDKSYEIREGDLLTVRSNGSKDLVGRCMLVPAIDEVISYSGFVIRIRCDRRAIVPRFLLHFMKSSETREQLTRDGGGTNISNINQGKLSALALPIPEPKVQTMVVENLDRLLEESQRLESIYQHKLAALDALKKSLLHQAFTGALTSKPEKAVAETVE